MCYILFMIVKEDNIFGKERRTTLLDPRSEALVEKYLPSHAALSDTAEAFAALADTGRLRIVSALYQAVFHALGIAIVLFRRLRVDNV